MLAQLQSRSNETPALLTLDSLVPFLLRRQLLTTADVVDDEPVILDRTRRNRNFKIHLPNNKGLLVKQVGAFIAERTQTLAAEADFLRAVASDDGFSDVRWFIPRYVHHDPDHAALVTELVHPATSLTKLHFNAGDIRFPPDSAVTSARILARLHHAGAKARAEGSLPFQAREPFVFDIRRMAERRSADNRTVYGAFEDLIDAHPFLWKRAEDLKAGWGSHAGIVHGDVRWDNFLVTHGSAPGRNLNLRLIDWEFVAQGDPAWDVACYLAEHLRFWLFFTNRNLETVEQALKKSPFPIAALREPANTFWTTYCRTLRFPPARRQATLERILAYLPLNFLLIGWEGLYRQPKIPGTSRIALQLAARAEDDPRAFVNEWLGIAEEVNA